MKQKNLLNQLGFTITELLVVLVIMIMLATVIIIDFNRQRGTRNANIAKNETVTNLRKVQSYMLSSRNIEEGVPAKYYIAQFKKGEPSYTVQAIDNTFEFHDNLETINLPSNINFLSLIQTDTIGNAEPAECMQIAFSAPFGTMYVFSSRDCGSTIVNALEDPLISSTLGSKTAYIDLAVDGEYNSSVAVQPLTGKITTLRREDVEDGRTIDEVPPCSIINGIPTCPIGRCDLIDGIEVCTGGPQGGGGDEVPTP